MQDIVDFIRKHDNFIVTSHVAPDGDNIGSSIGMTQFLSNNGKKAYHFLDDKIPSSLEFITNRVKIFKSEEFGQLDKFDNYTVIVLDCGNKGRVNVKDSILSNASNTICIDHHENGEFFADLNFIDEDASSTCELVYDFAKLYDETKINEIVATALYTGLATDTGHFKYDCTHVSSFLMAADLVKKGAEKQEMIKSVYQSDEYNYKKLESHLILNNMEKLDDICIMTMPSSILKEYKIDLKDTENMVNNTVNISGVEVGVLLKEKEGNIVKASLRSKERVNVAKIAQCFSGGGHERASGFTMHNTDLTKAREEVLKKIKEFM